MADRPPAHQVDRSEERLKHPPCLECGAKTEDEAQTKCICAGDKDDCHGVRLWPDDEPAKPDAGSVSDGYKEALQRIKALPVRPFPDPVAHSWEAFGRAVMGAFTDSRMAAIRALSAAPPAPEKD